MNRTLSTALFTILLAGSAIASSNTPLSAEQMNALPPEVQARVHVMMGAKKVETRIKPDGTTAEVYQEPPLPNAHVAAIEQHYADKQIDNADVKKEPSVPLAEAAMMAPKGQTLPSAPHEQKLNMINYSISTLGDLSSAPFHKEEKVRVRLHIPDALDFITHFDQYLPYLKKVTIVEISFTDAQEQDPHFLDFLRAFAQKVDSHLIYKMTLSGGQPVNFSLYLHLSRNTLKQFGAVPDFWTQGTGDPFALKLGFSQAATKDIAKGVSIIPRNN